MPTPKPIPCVILIDTSQSMEPHESELYAGLAKLKATLSGPGNEQARARLRLSVMSFNWTPRVVTDFQSVDTWDPTASLGKCIGGTILGAAMRAAVDRLLAKSAEYDQHYGGKIVSPWLYVFTDGHPSLAGRDQGGEPAAELDATLSRCRELEAAGRLFVFPVGVRNADKTVLTSMTTRKGYFVEDSDFEQAFVLLGQSIAMNSRALKPVDLMPLRSVQVLASTDSGVDD